MVLVKLRIDDDAELKNTIRTHIKELAYELLKTDLKVIIDELFKEKEDTLKELARTYFQKGYTAYSNIRHDWQEEIKRQIQLFCSEKETKQLMKEILIEKLIKEKEHP